jgi:TM2 domain-containing membrane protein YozV
MKVKRGETMNRTWVIVATVINLIVPGVGTLLIGKLRAGVLQLGIVAALWILTLISFGLLHPILLPIALANRAWALASGLLSLATGKRANRESLI